MVLPIDHDRSAQFLVAADQTLDFDTAQRRLAQATLYLTVDDLASPWAQAALLTVVRCGRRMFRGGVFLSAIHDARCTLSLHGAHSIVAAAQSLGAVLRPAPPGAFHLHLGPKAPASARLVGWTEGWDACVGPALPSDAVAAPGNVLSGVLAAAMAIAEAFRVAVLADLLAGRTVRRLSAWGPDAPSDAQLSFLPGRLWLLGLGNLGQASLFTLSLLPYAAPTDLHLVLQDFDVAGPENLPVQILTETSWVGRRKTRCLADWTARLGIDSRLVEIPFNDRTAPADEDPRILLAGVDNLEARRWAASAGFDLVIDAGLGATAADAFDVRLHAFPGARDAMAAWPQVAGDADPLELNPALRRAVETGQLDLCGAMTIAGKSVGVPCTAVAAAALQVGQLVRALATSRACDLVDLSLAGARATYRLMASPLRAGLAFTRALSV